MLQALAGGLNNPLTDIAVWSTGFTLLGACLDSRVGELIRAAGQREQRQHARLGQRSLRADADAGQYLSMLLCKRLVLLHTRTPMGSE